MIFNLDKIAYVFQIPLAWYRAVHARCFRSYPGAAIDLKEQPDGGVEIGVDVEELKRLGVGGGADLSGVGASKLVGTDANSEPVAATSLLTTNPTVDKVLTVKKNGMALTWEDADRPAENPSSTTNLSATYPGNDAATNNSWTAGSTTGLTITQLVRVKWSGTYLYGYYRTFKHDRFGRLYSVSAETRYTIDTPVTYNP